MLDEQISYEISAAVHALVCHDSAAFGMAAARVAEGPGAIDWRSSAERALVDNLRSAVGAAWRSGWQPADLVRLAARELNGKHADLARVAVRAELQGYPRGTIDPRWTAQLAELETGDPWPADRPYLREWSDAAGIGWASAVRCALEVLALFLGVPELERLGPIPGAAQPPRSGGGVLGPGIDNRVLTRVRALLAKAESTTFAPEAETFTAGAQALMARHSIDRALLAAAGGVPADEPAGRRIAVDNPYEGPKTMLLGAVAHANRCRVVWNKQLGFCTAVGFGADLDAVEVLFTSLLVQATTVMMRAGSRDDASGRSRTRSFRHSFLTAYASRIGERLDEATGSQTAQAAAEPAGGNLLPVLAARDRDVEEAVSAMFPHLTRRSVGSVTNRQGWVAGRAAADLATLNAGPQLPT